MLVGLFIHWLGNPGEIGLIIDNIHLNGGRLPMNENPSMILSSLISIASGGSAGPEAPMVQVTGSIGTWLADRFQLRGEALRTLSIAGMASGFRVLFGAPLGGTFFALEILHHQNVVEYFEAILPAVVASCASYTIFVAITQLGIGPTWHFPQYNVDSLYDFGAAIAYGIVAVIVGWLFIAVFRNCGTETGKKDLSERIHNCSNCGYITDRDVASAQVGLIRGLAAVGHTACDAC